LFQDHGTVRSIWERLEVLARDMTAPSLLPGSKNPLTSQEFHSFFHPRYIFTTRANWHDVCKSIHVHFSKQATGSFNMEEKLTHPSTFSFPRHPNLLVNRIAHNLLNELRLMMEMLGEFASFADFANLEQTALSSLCRVGRQIAAGKAMPWVRVKHSSAGHPAEPIDRYLRIGVFPTAANPFHWAHLLGGLLAMESFALDKIIFVIAGKDSRKPDMAPEALRHSMAISVLKLFHPLFEYSPIALGEAASGEENLFSILGMNPHQRIHAFYLAGGDHYHRYHPGTGQPDTIQKLEEGIACGLHGYDSLLHRVTAVFLERGRPEGEIPTSLDVRWVTGLSVQTSSTNIRQAFSDRRCWQNLAALPFAVFASIQGNRLYQVKAGKEALELSAR